MCSIQRSAESILEIGRQSSKLGRSVLRLEVVLLHQHSADRAPSVPRDVHAAYGSQPTLAPRLLGIAAIGLCGLVAGECTTLSSY